MKNDEDGNIRTDGGTPGRKNGHGPEWRVAANPDEEVELTCDCFVDCGEHFDESGADAHRLVKEILDLQPLEITRHNRHYYQCRSCGTEPVATHPDCPDESQFGVNVISQAALSRYDHLLPYRNIADRFEPLNGLGLSGASAWHATERAELLSRFALCVGLEEGDLPSRIS